MGCGKSKEAFDEKKTDIAAAADDANDACRKVIVVFGATGQQGGSVVRAMKDDKNFILKAATRNPDSDKAKQLTEEGDFSYSIACIRLTYDEFVVGPVSFSYLFILHKREKNRLRLVLN